MREKVTEIYWIIHEKYEKLSMKEAPRKKRMWLTEMRNQNLKANSVAINPKKTRIIFDTKFAIPALFLS